jgi:alkylation response protein AidB-like acyl-CoA dehydrogenase
MAPVDFLDSPTDAAFRTECRTWLEQHAPPRVAASGPDVISLLGRDVDTGPALAEARAWQAMAAADGWAGIGWPREFGGRGATFMEQVIYTQEAARFAVPDHVFRFGVSMAGPTVIGHGTDAQKGRWLRPIITGEEIWCQLFSEPGAGSDLAGLRTSATRDGDEWVVNGQKVWSSGAHYSQQGMLLARTDPDAPKHRGITYFALDMSLPGIEVRPLRQMTGSSHFNEVFFTDVRVPDVHRIGDVNDGWRVAQTTLMNERASIVELLGDGNAADPLVGLARAADAAGRAGVRDPRVRQELARLYIESAIVRYLGLRIVTAFSRGRFPGPEASVAKLAMSTLFKRSSGLALALLGADSMIDSGSWTRDFLAAPALRLGGGTDEVQRNIIGERALGLPKDPGPSRDTPFRDLPK